MKKKIGLVMLLLGTMIMGTSATMAKDLPVRVFVNTQEIYFFDGAPYVDSSNRTQIPVRYVSEKLGAMVNWSAKTQLITIIDGNKQIVLKVNEKEMTINGQSKQLDTAATIKKDRTYVPLRFVSEALGAEVKWDQKGRVVYISNGKAPLPDEKVYTSCGEFVVPVTKDSRGGYKSGTYNEQAGIWSIETGKGLLIEGRDRIDENRILLALVPSESIRGSMDEQYKEARNILMQKISEELVDEMITYAKQQTTGANFIEEKWFYEGKYRILVSPENASNYSNIRVFLK